MASGHVNRTYRGRTHGRTDQYCTREESPCQLGAVHTWPLATDRIFMADGRFGCEADIEPELRVHGIDHRHLAVTFRVHHPAQRR